MEFRKSCGAWELFGLERTVHEIDGTDQVVINGFGYTRYVKSFKKGEVGQHLQERHLFNFNLPHLDASN